MENKNIKLRFNSFLKYFAKYNFAKYVLYEIPNPAFEKERYLYKFNLTQLYDRR